jgi:hypothetical protein
MVAIASCDTWKPATGRRLIKETWPSHLARECGCAYNLACPNGKGRLAQWLERLVHTEEVGGSTPPSPTMLCGTPRVQVFSLASLMPRWRNGRRAAFRAQCPYGCVGSNPSLGTKQANSTQ